MFELEQPRAYEEEDNVEENDEPTEESTKNITQDQLGLIISKANELCDLIKELDPVIERQNKAENGNEEVMKDYKDEQRKQKEMSAKKRKQASIGDFFAKKAKQ